MGSDDLTAKLPDPMAQLVAELRNEVGNLNRHLEIGFNSVEARFNAIDTRLSAIDARLDAVDTRLSAIDTRLDAVDARFDPLGRDLKNINENLGRVHDAIDALNRRTLHTDTDYAALLRRVEELERKAS